MNQEKNRARTKKKTTTTTYGWLEKIDVFVAMKTMEFKS